MDDGRLRVTVAHADGRTTRWSFDEVDSGVIPNDLQFSTSVPGGFKDASCSLLREIEPRADEALFDDLRIYGPGGQTAFEGRIAQMPRQGGRQATVTPGAVGWSAHLEDYAGFQEIYVDRNIGGFSEPPIERKADVLGSSISMGDLSITTEGGALVSALPNQALGAQTLAEVWYRAPSGVNVGKIMYVGSSYGLPSGWLLQLFATDHLDGSSATSLGYNPDGTLRTITVGTPRRYLLHQVYSDGNAATPTAGANAKMERVAIYGDHGLTLLTTTPGQPYGVLGSAVVADVVSRACPLLTFTTGPAGSIRPTTFVIPHLTFVTPTTAAEAISTANAYHGWDWAVWENRTFYFQPQDSSVEWQARVADGAQLSLEGDTAEQLINGVIVSYTDGGVQKLAGPVGSGCDVESASLQDDAADNPVNAHGIPRRWPVLPISFPTTDAGAVELGAIYLAERNLAARKGQITLQGTVRHPTEGMVPVWRIRAGDSVIVTDRAGDVARRIVGTTYSHATRTISLDCGIGSNKLDALLERVAVYTGALT